MYTHHAEICQNPLYDQTQQLAYDNVYSPDAYQILTEQLATPYQVEAPDSESTCQANAFH